MKKRRKRRIKWDRVLLLIIFPILIIGGIVMYFNYDMEKNEISNKVDNNIENKEEGENEEVVVELPKAPINSVEYNNLSDGEYLTSNGYTLKIEDGLAYVDGNLIVNKTYSLPSNYLPSNPYQAVSSNTGKCNNCIDKEVMQAFKLMKSDATSIGLSIYIASGYRSYAYQEGLYNRYSAVDGITKADTYSARPGHSEHQTGLCFDLNEVTDNFATTDEGKWVNDNAYLYGFIIRYPKGKESITGYKYESWHLRYVGVDLATKLYNNGDWLTMEEYYGLSSSY